MGNVFCMGLLFIFTFPFKKNPGLFDNTSFFLTIYEMHVLQQRKHEKNVNICELCVLIIFQPKIFAKIVIRSAGKNLGVCEN